MNVAIHFVLFLASSTSALPPPTTTEPPPACTCRDGTKLSVGEQHFLNDCDICDCDEDGAHLIVGDCFFAECVDSVDIKGDGNCCPVCPNGRNCGVVDGSYGVFRPIPHGKTIDFGHATCSCDVNKFSYDSQFPIADCVLHVPYWPMPPTTPPMPPPPPSTPPPSTPPPPTPTPPPATHPPPPGCKCSDNTIIPIGQSHRINDCLTCKCDEKTGEQYVKEECSTKVACADYKAVDGDGICCPSCPNGKNCKAEVGSNTTIIPDGQTIVFSESKCTCDVSNQANSASFYPKATCENI